MSTDTKSEKEVSPEEIEDAERYKTEANEYFKSKVHFSLDFPYKCMFLMHVCSWYSKYILFPFKMIRLKCDE